MPFTIGHLANVDSYLAEEVSLVIESTVKQWKKVQLIHIFDTGVKFEVYLKLSTASRVSLML